MPVSRVFSFLFCSFLLSFVLIGVSVSSPVLAQTAEVDDAVADAGDTFSSGEDAVDNDAFFDAEDMVPRGEMARHGPNKVDPNTQPASRLVIVKKNQEADTTESRLVAAERAMKLGRNDSALDLFDTLYAKNKKDARVLMGRAIVLQKSGRFDEAMAMYEELSNVEPDNLEVKVNMLGLLSTRFPSIALRRLLELRKDNMSHVGLASQIAVCYAALGDAKEALRYMGAAASIEPKNATHLYNMAIIADRSGDRKQAVSYYERALEVDSVHGGGRSIPRETVYERLAQLR
jgi:Flp pilus assembly protein TadD